VDFVSVQDNIDTRSTGGGIFYQVIAALSESEKIPLSGIIARDRKHLGKLRRNRGRPNGLSGDSIIKVRKAKQLCENREMTVADIARSIGIGKTTLYRYLRFSGSRLVKTKKKKW
jgi:DNA invertase Pin-like site-specific DNA recombinase